MSFRIFATTNIGPDALQRLRDKDWDLEVYDHVVDEGHIRFSYANSMEKIAEALNRIRGWVEAQKGREVDR